MRDSINFYSNCLIEALKAKIKHPITTKIKKVLIPDSFFPHFIWINNDVVKEFGKYGKVKWYNSFLYKGYIRTHEAITYQEISEKLEWKIKW